MKTLSIIKATWPDDTEQIKTIREHVFVLEQGVSAKIEWDGRDHLCMHVLAVTSEQEIVGTGRVLPSGHIGRIAVLASYRGQGVGKAILEKLITLALENSQTEIYLNSQTHAISFYQRSGFEVSGPVFMEAGIPHQRMRLIFDE